MATQQTPTADSRLVQDVAQQVARRVVGQDYMVDRLLISLLTGGHVLLEGVPGLAKTLTVRTLAAVADAGVAFVAGTRGLFSGSLADAWAARLCESWVPLHSTDPCVRAGLATVEGRRLAHTMLRRHRLVECRAKAPALECCQAARRGAEAEVVGTGGIEPDAACAGGAGAWAAGTGGTGEGSAVVGPTGAGLG